MRKSVVGLLAAALIIPAVASAQTPANPWTVRARAISIIPNASSDPEGLDVNADFTAEIDISRRFGSMFGAELILATAGHEVTATAEGEEVSLGSVNILPPTLLAQFFIPVKGKVHPYIGAGVNLTVFYDKTGALEPLDVNTAVGFAGQAGIDFDIGERAMFNVDFKYVKLGTNVELDGEKLFELDIDPMIIGVGFGYRF